MPPRPEYRYTQISGAGADQVNELLRSWSEKGWTLHSFTEFGGYGGPHFSFIFEREAASSPTAPGQPRTVRAAWKRPEDR